MFSVAHILNIELEMTISEKTTLIIAEVAQAHDGSLGTAHAYINAIANAGADAIKFQTHIASAESTKDEPWRIKFSPQDDTRYDYWKRMEFTEEQWGGLAEHARARGLMFLSSPFSFQAIEILDRIGMEAWKIGAGEITNLPLINKAAITGKQVILSSGMSTWNELDAAVNTVRNNNAEVAVLQCTSSYPCPAEKLGLNVISELRQRYHCQVGLSDHSGTIYAGIAAATLGANIIEVHVTFSHECFGPDVSSSITTAELGMLVEGVRFIESAMSHPVDKNIAADSFSEMKQIFGKSIVAARDLEAGAIITIQDIAFKKPGMGIPPSHCQNIINRKLSRDIKENKMITMADFV